MPTYLQRFYEKLKERYAGCLIKTKDLKELEPHAKEYLNQLSKTGLIERIRWGWYWVPDDVNDPWDFFERDKGLKIISCQTAASLWNQDFVHRDTYSLKVANRSYGRALEEFAKKKGWTFQVEYVEKPKKYQKVGKLLVQDMDETVIECMQRWAFTDAFAVIYSNSDKINMKDLYKKSYWKRIQGTNIRVRQALEYGCHFINKLSGKKLLEAQKTRLADEYLKREIEEAAQKVVELG